MVKPKAYLYFSKGRKVIVAKPESVSVIKNLNHFDSRVSCQEDAPSLAWPPPVCLRMYAAFFDAFDGSYSLRNTRRSFVANVPVELAPLP